jgi:hypothetical protein
MNNEDLELVDENIDIDFFYEDAPRKKKVKAKHILIYTIVLTLFAILGIFIAGAVTMARYDTTKIVSDTYIKEYEFYQELDDFETHIFNFYKTNYLDKKLYKTAQVTTISTYDEDSYYQLLEDEVAYVDEFFSKNATEILRRGSTTTNAIKANYYKFFYDGSSSSSSLYVVYEQFLNDALHPGDESDGMFQLLAQSEQYSVQASTNTALYNSLNSYIGDAGVKAQFKKVLSGK